MEMRLMLTAACNFNCFFCLNEYWTANQGHSVLTPTQYRELVSAAISAISTQQVTITGGEPTLHPQLSEIIGNLRSLPIELTMVTNGSLIPNNIEAIGLLDELHVSFHSWDEHAWQRITRSRSRPSDIARNIIEVRRIHPNLTVKINVVAGPSNSDKASIDRYVRFAADNNLKINVYRQSTVRTARLQSRHALTRQVVTDWWQIALLGGEIVERNDSKTSFRLGSAEINLATTSTDGSRWSSIWISPEASAYVDILHGTPDVPMLSALNKRQWELIQLMLFNLSSEAALHRLVDRSHCDVPVVLGDLLNSRGHLIGLLS